MGFEWDQTPHVYSTSARTLYNGVGSTRLTLPPGLSNQMFTDAGCLPGPAGCGLPPIPPANAALVQRDIVNNAYQTDLGIRRDTAAVDYRYTPNDNWDLRANYSHMRRTGTQVDGVLFGPQVQSPRVDAPRPVADTTQNYGASTEYFGNSFWNQKFNVKVAYSGSTYTDDSSAYTVENPFCPTGAVDPTCAFAGSPSAPVALMSLWPSNQANGVSATMGADLPWRSRYMATVAYTSMRQNDAFLPFTITPFTTTGGVPPGWGGTPGIPMNSTAALPVQSLNGNINTLLSNNVITTQITPDLKFKANYRYYNYQNGTPEIRFADWVHADSVSARNFIPSYGPVQSISPSYTKQNAGGELTWRPWREWNIGAAYGFERYDWVRADANATNENSGKVYADWKPTRWITARASLLAASRRYETYDYPGFVERRNGRTAAAPSSATPDTQPPTGSSCSTIATESRRRPRSPSICCATSLSRRPSRRETTIIGSIQTPRSGCSSTGRRPPAWSWSGSPVRTPGSWCPICTICRSSRSRQPDRGCRRSPPINIIPRKWSIP